MVIKKILLSIIFWSSFLLSQEKEIYKPYVYKALVTSVYDGDTITVDINLGFNVILKNQKIRLSDVDTPELRGDEKEEGIKVRDYVREMILNKQVIIKTEKDKKGKYGRWLAVIYINNLNLNEDLKKQGYKQKR